MLVVCIVGDDDETLVVDSFWLDDVKTHTS